MPVRRPGILVSFSEGTGSKGASQYSRCPIYANLGRSDEGQTSIRSLRGLVKRGDELSESEGLVEWTGTPI